LIDAADPLRCATAGDFGYSANFGRLEGKTVQLRWWGKRRRYRSGETYEKQRTDVGTPLFLLDFQPE